jgi:hypothetical protein
MTIGRRFFLVVVPLAFLAPMPSQAADNGSNGSWDGTWTGLLNKRAPVSITIANGKVVSYAIEGAPLDIQYSKVTPTSVSFGDRDHYGVRLTKTNDTTASEIAHGRNGYGSASLTKH